MRSVVFYLVPAVLVLLFIAAGIPAILSPIVYEKTPAGFSTAYHIDPSLYPVSTINASQTGSSTMQELIDVSSSVSMSIRVKDPEAALRDISEYRNAIGSMDQIVVRFDMNQTELQAYVQSHRENAEILEELVNQTSRYDQLKRLEVQFRDDNDPAGLISVIYEEEAIRNRIGENLGSYQKNNRVIESTAEKYDLNVTSTIQSEQNLAGMKDELDSDRIRMRQTMERLQKENNYITLFVDPEKVVYGDTVRIWGNSRTTGTRDHSVHIFLDGAQIGEIPANSDGRYEYLLPVDRIDTGIHEVYVQDNIRQSAISGFSVDGTESEITLVTGVQEQDWLNCSGSLSTSKGAGVKGAPVEIIWDNSNAIVTETGITGSYLVKVVLPPGSHTIKARFLGTGYPVGPSESVKKSVFVAGQGGLWGTAIAVLVYGGIMLSSGMGAVFYLKRRKNVSNRILGMPDPFIPASGSEPPLQTGTITDDRAVSFIDLFVRFLERAGVREAAFAVYRHFTARVEQVFGFPRMRTLTPRELAARSIGHPFYAAFVKFLPRYEWIRYGPDPGSDLQAFENSVAQLDRATRDEKEN